ncbi:MAG: hypothetical protein NZ529_02185 [Cytophagaceae bacterium]|nr:hypothetical protein [Cytophagaceae bacterium]MDW8455577.1 hypothetical protein [Cytophagaceae bacterium]
MNERKIAHVFSCIQECIIEKISLDGKTLNIQLECSHLENFLGKDQRNLFLVLKELTHCRFQFWDDEDIIIDSIREIELLKPEIINADIMHDGMIKIYCDCKNLNTGGNLMLCFDDIKVYNSFFDELNTEQLIEMSEKYWYSGEAEY